MMVKSNKFQALQDGKIDAAFIVAGAPTTAVTSLAATKKVAEDHIAELRAMAGLLLEQETIYAQDIEAIMGKAA